MVRDNHLKELGARNQVQSQSLGQDMTGVKAGAKEEAKDLNQRSEKGKQESIFKSGTTTSVLEYLAQTGHCGQSTGF